MHPFLQNILLGITLAAPVGPASVAILKSGFQGGFFSAFKTALGVVSADLVYVLVAFFGLASLITLPLVKVGILFFGMLVLGYIGLSTLHSAWKAPELKMEPKQTRRSQFIEGFAVNISNPLAVVWWLGLIGSILASAGTQNGAPGSGAPFAALIYPLTIILGILIWHTGLSLFSHFSHRILGPRILRAIALVSGVVLLAFALRFGWQALQIALSAWQTG